eukprot:1365704-Rhodomonas_salina.1
MPSLVACLRPEACDSIRNARKSENEGRAHFAAGAGGRARRLHLHPLTEVCGTKHIGRRGKKPISCRILTRARSSLISGCGEANSRGSFRRVGESGVGCRARSDGSWSRAWSHFFESRQRAPGACEHGIERLPILCLSRPPLTRLLLRLLLCPWSRTSRSASDLEHGLDFDQDLRNGPCADARCHRLHKNETSSDSSKDSSSVAVRANSSYVSPAFCLRSSSSWIASALASSCSPHSPTLHRRYQRSTCWRCRGCEKCLVIDSSDMSCWGCEECVVIDGSDMHDTRADRPSRASLSPRTPAPARPGHHRSVLGHQQPGRGAMTSMEDERRKGGQKQR